MRILAHWQRHYRLNINRLLYYTTMESAVYGEPQQRINLNQSKKRIRGKLGEIMFFIIREPHFVIMRPLQEFVVWPRM